MTGKDLDEFEQEAAKELKMFRADLPVSEARVLSKHVLEILMSNAQSHGDVIYSSSGHDYSVSFGYAEVKLENGKIGVYNEISQGLAPEDTVTVSFLVTGFHKSEETEVQFSDEKIMLNSDREFKHLVEFQRAVLTKGTF